MKINYPALALVGFLLAACSSDTRDYNAVFREIGSLEKQNLPRDTYLDKKRDLVSELVEMWNTGNIPRLRKREVLALLYLHLSDYPDGTFPKLRNDE